MDIIKILQENTAIISIFSLIISGLSFYLAASNYKNFARQEFVKKQIQVITELVQALHEDFITINFTSFKENASTATVYKATVFEIPCLKIIDSNPDFFSNVICFIGHSNQILNVKPYIDNPFLPRPIADKLENFYSRNHNDKSTKEINGEHVIIIASKHFEVGTFEQLDKHPNLIIKQPQCFALLNWNNLIECSNLLENAIIDYLKKYNVKDINIRKDFKYV